MHNSFLSYRKTLCAIHVVITSLILSERWWHWKQWEVILTYLIEHSQMTVTKMKLRCNISGRYFCLWFCVCVYGLVVKPVTGTISVEAAKLSCLFSSSGWCPISVTNRRVSERKVYAHPDPCALSFLLGVKDVSWQSPPGSTSSRAGLACMCTEGKALSVYAKHLFLWLCTETEASFLFE